MNASNFSISFGNQALYEESNAFFINATTMASQGHYKEAIKEVYRGIILFNLDRDWPDVDYHLRIPNYLVKDGRPDEAWQYYYAIFDFYERYSIEVRQMFYSQVYDKMRLFQQRQGRPELMLVYGILSHLAWAHGLYLQQRIGELSEMPYSFRNGLSVALKKSKNADLNEKAIALMRKHLERIGIIDLPSLEKELINELAE